MSYRFVQFLLVFLVSSVIVAGSYESAKDANNVVRDETGTGLNTAERLGDALNGVLDAAMLVSGSESEDFTAEAGYLYSVDTSTAAVTVTAPASPEAEDTFGVVDLYGNWATNNVTVDFGSSNLHAIATPLNLYIGNGAYAHRLFRFDGTRWLITN